MCRLIILSKKTSQWNRLSPVLSNDFHVFDHMRSLYLKNKKLSTHKWSDNRVRIILFSYCQPIKRYLTEVPGSSLSIGPTVLQIPPSQAINTFHPQITISSPSHHPFSNTGPYSMEEICKSGLEVMKYGKRTTWYTGNKEKKSWMVAIYLPKFTIISCHCISLKQTFYQR